VPPVPVWLGKCGMVHGFRPWLVHGVGVLVRYIARVGLSAVRVERVCVCRTAHHDCLQAQTTDTLARIYPSVSVQNYTNEAENSNRVHIAVCTPHPPPPSSS